MHRENIYSFENSNVKLWSQRWVFIYKGFHRLFRIFSHTSNAFSCLNIQWNKKHIFSASRVRIQLASHSMLVENRGPSECPKLSLPFSTLLTICFEYIGTKMTCGSTIFLGLRSLLPNQVKLLHTIWGQSGKMVWNLSWGNRPSSSVAPLPQLSQCLSLWIVRTLRWCLSGSTAWLKRPS